MSPTSCTTLPQRVLRRLLLARDRLERVMNPLQPLAALLARLYIARVFFLSGLTKLRDWDVTLDLFSYEYQVPLLPPEYAAVLGTAGEIALPVLLVLGLGGRLAPMGLFVVNAVAVESLTQVAPAALEQHFSWAIVLAGLAIFGNGRWALDSCWATKPHASAV